MLNLLFVRYNRFDKRNKYKNFKIAYLLASYQLNRVFIRRTTFVTVAIKVCTLLVVVSLSTLPTLPMISVGDITIIFRLKCSLYR